MATQQFEWQCRGRTMTWGRRPLIMGIVNVTPDSFSDGGRFADADAAVRQALLLKEQGADILDIGGESSRPHATAVPANEELGRVLPVVREVSRATDAVISIDTWKAEVAEECLKAGGHIVNDITGLNGDPQMARVVQDTGAGAVIMHMQGTPATMQDCPTYADVVHEIGKFFEDRLQELESKGIARQQLVVDPGIGFGKTVRHNVEILARLRDFARLGRPLCLGVSRKSFLGRLLDRPIHGRLAVSLAAALYGCVDDRVQILRVHDVQETRDALVVFDVIRRTSEELDAC